MKAGIPELTHLLGGEQLRFAVHGPGIPEASPRIHGVPGRDVACRVHISIASVSAGHAAKEGLVLTALRSDLPARRAALARVGGWNSLDPSGSLVLQAADECTPARTADGSIQTAVSLVDSEPRNCALRSGLT